MGHEEYHRDQAEALARIAEQLERLPGRMATTMGKRRPPTLDLQDAMLRAIGVDPDKERERARVAEEIRHLRQTRITAIVAVVFAGLSAAGTLALAVTQIL